MREEAGPSIDVETDNEQGSSIVTQLDEMQNDEYMCM